MTDEVLLQRIAQHPDVMAGQPVIRGTRLTVRFILNTLAHGTTIEELLSEYSGLEEADIQACLLFASQSLGRVDFMPLVAGAAE